MSEQSQRTAPEQPHAVKAVDDVPADTRRGGDVRTLLSPKTVGSTSGFMGVATIPPGDRISEHYHPYSEEFIYCVRGAITAQLDGEPHELKARRGAVHPDQREAPPRATRATRRRSSSSTSARSRPSRRLRARGHRVSAAA